MLGRSAPPGAGWGRAGRDVLILGNVARQVRDAGGVQHGGAEGDRWGLSHAMQLEWGALMLCSEVKDTVRLQI